MRGDCRIRATFWHPFLVDPSVWDRHLGFQHLNDVVRIRGALSLNHTEEFLWHAGLIKELVQDHDVDERTQGTNTALFVQALRCETLFVQALRYEKFCSAAFGPNVINQNWMMRLYMSFASWKFQQPQGCSSRAESCSTALAL